MSIEFENILNFRDAGKTVNDYLGQKIVREGVLYRSARPDEATLNDRRQLTEELGIRTVLDLRSKTEHAAQAEKRLADSKVPTLLQSNAALAEPVQIPGLVYHEVRVTGRRLEWALLRQLSWWSFIKLIILYILNFRVPAIRILGQEVMQPLGLTGLSLLTLSESGPELAQSLRALTSPHPTLVHCTHGRDRTGLVVTLALLTLGVPVGAIAHDYLLSQAGLERERVERVAEMRSIGLTPAWGDCPPDLIARVCEHLDVRYGGVEPYLDSVGFGVEERARLIEVLGA
ncbi:protein-tyrosine phosphatase-like protein [Hypoxylon argillaceum]|nr:protein-tyrosine phosphatase-like protein [Hypoxylon argillaceum]KAI1155760.1 protein-tyrosine phosphatase-like protein [Nemania diffusa]